MVQPMMNGQNSREQRQWLLWLALLLGVILSIMWIGAVARAEDSGWVGKVETMPTGGLIGQWRVGGRVFTTTNTTEFRPEKGPFVVGACVGVKYVGEAPPFQAMRMVTKEAKECLPGATPSVTRTPDGTKTPVATGTTTPGDDDDREGAKEQAVVEQMPERGLLGQWVIGGVDYVVAPGARLRQEKGPFAVGACVEVEYVVGATPRQVRKMETKRHYECAHDGTPAATPTLIPTAPPVGTPGAEFAVYGRVQSLPEGLLGNWVVDGVTYLATTDTEFKRERGNFAVGRCVKIHALNTTPVPTIREIENERGYHCAHDDDDDDEFQGAGVLFGKIQGLPADGLIGEWNIGGMTFVVTNTTELKARDGQFVVDVLVKVHFVVNAKGVNLARKIEIKWADDDDGHDDDGNGNFEGAEGHAFGTIEKLPTGDLIGEWVIGAISYTVTADTRFVEPPSNFVVGAKVRVKYYTDDQGNRLVRKIKTTNEHNGAEDPSHFTLFASVDKMPPSGFAGEWVLDHIAFVATGETKFVEEHGTLGVGAYVKVEYFIRNGRNVIHKLETEVPPGAGDDNNVGTIESTSDGLIAAGANGTVWVIGGKRYTVTPATDLNDLQSELTVGATALVNSYTAADGSLVATQISGITLDNRLFLPMAKR
ncbi:MAG: hypothetical protein DYG89_46540 [Caldilinea sp. CFX5]|nr:hypothetical protein [Caldilinea sp. CFX5]